MNFLLKGNNNKIIPQLIETGKTFDLILTDPPYNVSRKHQLGFSNMGRKGMDFGEWDYEFNQLTWLDGIAKVLNKNGSIIIFNDWKNMGLIATKLEKEGFIVKDLLKWEKKNPMPRNTNRRYVTDYEYAIWATKKGGKWTFNKGDKPYARPTFSHSIPAGGKKRIHPTQKPTSLLKEIIEIHTNKGDTILDPFSGSGSTGVAAEEIGRNFTLIERNSEFYEKSKEQFSKIATTL
ncbi:DNA-methyltransferase [Mycoplasma todarodis]|uniref:DNA-methyltransferase n=1 Tax=Mycoplasma todarodis TaxID=1937191 RepID=UPI003B2B22C3